MLGGNRLCVNGSVIVIINSVMLLLVIVDNIVMFFIVLNGDVIIFVLVCV